MPTDIQVKLLSAPYASTKQQLVSVLGEPTHDLERAREAIQRLPAPRGGCDWPQALQAAYKILSQSQRPQRDIIILSDGQRFGWADESTLFRWELLAPQLREALPVKPRIWVVNLDPARPAAPPNWSLAPVRANRGVAAVGQQVTFRTALELHGQEEYQPPYRVHVEVDGKSVTDLKPPTAARLENGQVPLSFSHRFTTPGSHLISVILEPDPPPEQRPVGYRVKDRLPGDNRQDFALEVVSALPVLLVDGDARANPSSRGTDFLRDALAPSRDPTPTASVRVLPMPEFDASWLSRDLAQPSGSRPRVLVFSNVPRLTPEQQDAVARFLADGGGVLLTLGDRVDARAYNEQLYRTGQGWLPARLEEIAGNTTEPNRAVSPLASSFFHPSLELFREVQSAGLGDARFPRWWKVNTSGVGGSGVPVALLTNNDPFLVERSYRGGRVLLCTVPLDNSWRTNLPDLPAFAPLAHELVYYLAGARSAEFNLQPGQPLRYRPAGDEPPGRVVFQPPEGDPQPRTAERWPLVVEDAREPGVYRLHSGGRVTYYVVQPDHRESDLTPCTEADREKVGKLLPLSYENNFEKLIGEVSHRSEDLELWRWFMVGVVMLLCCEVWFTRRIVKNS